MKAIVNNNKVGNNNWKNERCKPFIIPFAGYIHSDETDDDGDGYVECAININGWDGSVSVVGGDDCDDTDFASTTQVSDEDCDGTVRTFDCDDTV